MNSGQPPAASRQRLSRGARSWLSHPLHIPFRPLPLVRQGLLLVRAPHALRWRLETFGLYMPSLPEARPWWRVNVRALGALLRQLPGYARWLAEMQELCRGEADAPRRKHNGVTVQEWEEWLRLSE